MHRGCRPRTVRLCKVCHTCMAQGNASKSRWPSERDSHPAWRHAPHTALHCTGDARRRTPPRCTPLLACGSPARRPPPPAPHPPAAGHGPPRPAARRRGAERTRVSGKRRPRCAWPDNAAAAAARSGQEGCGTGISRQGARRMQAGAQNLKLQEARGCTPTKVCACAHAENAPARRVMQCATSTTSKE